jgi:hypothetical protein
VRNDQRRSRARRKAYVAELEAKIRQYDIESGQICTTAELLRATQEAEFLKGLLHLLGLDGSFLQAFTRAQRLAPILAHKQGETASSRIAPRSSSHLLDALSMSVMSLSTTKVVAP